MCAVEWKTLDCICSLITKQTGFDYSKTIKPSLSNVNDIGYIPFIQNKDFNGVNINLKTDYYVPKEIAMQFPKILLDDKALLISISGKIGNVGYYELPQISFIGGAICICRLNGDTNGKYLMYYLQSNKGQNYLFSSVKAASHSNITIEDIRKVIIPIPSLAKQQEIVSHLDTFTTLISKLESELDMRRKQYEHYRNQLLDFEGVEIKTLNEIADIVVGFPFDSSKFVDNGTRLMRGMNIKRGYLDFDDSLNKYWNTTEGLQKYELKTNDIVISMDGSLVGRSFAIIEQKHLPLLLVQRVARIRSNYNIKFIYYNICMFFSDYVDKKKTAGAIPHISMKDIQNFSIPFPSSEAQQEIVEKLDAFENLIQSLDQEIKLREKQYEYYREKLLTFE